MPDNNNDLIGLTELIEQIKQDLMSASLDQQTEVPLFGISAVELELQVTVKKEGKGGLKFYVIDFGGAASRDDVQKVKVSLSPLLSKEQLLSLYKQRYPEKWEAFLATISDTLLKGSDDDPEI
ncbi:MAG: hypothetical protein KME43_24565 [Myxacorys chilensis ATA2-1-KO14]|jgi:hypothetical protein|nr:hypothetical protein [Myxacorys chilensis ATA2-1-KO14]